MPIIDVSLLEGRSEAQKKLLISELTDAAVRAVGAPKETIRVIIREMPPAHYGIAGKSVEK